MAILLLLVPLLASYVAAQYRGSFDGSASLVRARQATNTSGSTFTNPVLDDVGADPWVFRYNDYYYLTYTTSSDITLLRSPVLTDWNNAERKLLYQPPKGTNYSTNLWAPELHNLDGNWYVIFTADPNNDSPPPEVDMLCEFNCPAVYHRVGSLSVAQQALILITFKDVRPRGSRRRPLGRHLYFQGPAGYI